SARCAPPKGGERPAALTRNGSSLAASAWAIAPRCRFTGYVVLPAAQDLLIRAKHLFIAVSRDAVSDAHAGAVPRPTNSAPNGVEVHRRPHPQMWPCNAFSYSASIMGR